jgi:hypothetical protein
MSTHIVWIVEGQQKEGPEILKPSSQLTLKDVKQVWDGPPSVFLFRTYGNGFPFPHDRERERTKPTSTHILN